MKKRDKKWLTLIAILLIVIGLSITITQQHNRPCDYPEIAARGVLHVSVIHSPLSYNTNSDSIHGYDYELLQLLGSQSGLEIEITPEPHFSHCLQQLNKRTCDIVAHPIAITSQSQAEYIHSLPTSLNKQVLIQRTDSTGSVAIRNQLDLRGCTLHIIQDSPSRLRIENLAHEIGDNIYICEKHNYNVERLVEEVANGSIDYAVCDEASVRIVATKYCNIDYKTDISFTQFMAWTMRNESTELCDSINSWLMSIEKTEQFRELYTRYFGTKNYDKLQRINPQLYTPQRDSIMTSTEEVKL